jgi:hypothetical protein
MGFLDNSTNNIIIDAVLTDTGRAFLARNDGSFSIVKFAMGDDEVDYSTIQKYGRTVGKERIEKNTPVLEAETMGDFALKHRLISHSNPNLIRLPKLELTGQGSNTFSMAQKGSTSGIVSTEKTVQQKIANESTIDQELTDKSFIVRMNNFFLQLAGLTPDNVDSDNIATYIVLPDADTTGTLGAKVTLALETKSITQPQFSIYGNVTDKSIIATIISVAGVQSGAVLSLNINISQT